LKLSRYGRRGHGAVRSYNTESLLEQGNDK
jgi:hypothetical protein